MTAYANEIFVLLAWLAITVYVMVNSRKIGYLKAVAYNTRQPLPEVALIIPIRNEEKSLRQALTTLAALDYPNYRVLLMNDGSTDNSAAIIQEFAQTFPHISCCHLDTLPGGWIGKSHALYNGYRQSTEPWLLFTDADVRFEKDSLTKAIQYCLQTGTRHLTILPHICSRSTMVNCVNSFFQLLMHLRYRPWATADASSSAYMGMGAFNLVHRAAYEAIGTHARFALHPNDDLKLGECIKMAGYSQHVLYGQGAIQYEWYRSLEDFINGLTKNAFSSVRYNVALALMSIVGSVLFFVLPVPLMLLSGNGVLQGIGVALLCVQAVLLAWRKGADGRWWYALLMPLSALVIAFIMLRSAMETLYHNGVYWSERFYKLSELKKCR